MGASGGLRGCRGLGALEALGTSGLQDFMVLGTRGKPLLFKDYDPASAFFFFFFFFFGGGGGGVVFSIHMPNATRV